MINLIAQLVWITIKWDIYKLFYDILIEYLSGFVREDISLYYIIRLESKINYSLPLISPSTALKIHVTPNPKQTLIYKTISWLFWLALFNFRFKKHIIWREYEQNQFLLGSLIQGQKEVLKGIMTLIKEQSDQPKTFLETIWITIKLNIIHRI